MSFKPTIRRSQLITTYGVGSIVPVEDQSFMIAGIDNWGDLDPDVQEPRLEKQLGVAGFVLPPDEDSGHKVPAVRFPNLYSCPVCNRLAPHGFFGTKNNRCNVCNVPLVPSRFVIVCEDGHIDDFPYFEWVHSGKPKLEGVKHNLKIIARGASAALRDIIIECSCGASRNMQGAFGREALVHVIGHCRGKRPWLGDQGECSKVPRTLQRGASNVYFPMVHSALSIPPWSEGAFRVLSKHWKTLKAVPEAALEATLEALDLARDGEYDVADLVQAVKLRKAADSGDTAPPPTESDLRQEEYDALVKGKPETSGKQDFVCIPADSMQTVYAWFDKVMLITRLREVRALSSFVRLVPPSPADPEERKARLSKERVNWLPAIEVLGEGVFIRFESARLKEWEMRPDVIARAKRINDNYIKKFAEHQEEPDRTITPRFILIHALAHVLIGEWALAAGYPAAALRERLYASDDMCGLLIYTATSDAAGSLGGVVDGARGNRLARTLDDAIRRASWCSSDPLCIEADAAGTDALNIAACHACVLLPEVSCEEMNVLLDRAMLVGTPDNPSLGFFAEMLVGA